jgi:uncharacterized protein YndB with AHSA1/START domain
MTEYNVLGNVTTNIGEREFIMERIYDAPRELVFKAFTESSHLARWWAPGEYTVPVCKIDLRPGGIWHYCMESPEGERHWARSVYREIVVPERIVYTSTFADEKANPIEGIPEHLATITFGEYEGKTKLTVRIQFESAKDLKTTLELGMVQGLTETLNTNLDNLLKEIN